MPSKLQIETLRKIGRNRENIHVAALGLGLTDKGMNKRVTRIFQEFEQDLDLMIEYFPVFKRRFEGDPEAYKKVRRLSRLVGGEVKILQAAKPEEDSDNV